MTSSGAAVRSLALERLPTGEGNYSFTTPTKRINDGDDLTFFLSSIAYRDLMTWLLQLNRSVFPTKDEQGQIHDCRLNSPPPYSQFVQNVRQLLSTLSDLIKEAPLDQGPRRFGNVAFRTWYTLVEARLDGLVTSYLQDAFEIRSPEQQALLRGELKFYLMGSFGSAQRLDYGTGHELSFLAFLGCLWKLGAFQEGEERAIVVGLVQPYLELVRRLVLTYTLEPAGSHGVWGLDDHSFIPYIFGSAEYGPPIDPKKTNVPLPTEGSLDAAPSPTTVMNKTEVSSYQSSNMYFSAIQFIYDVKRGPFWEHSPVLYDVSGIKDGWAKINKGMLKMYAAEVLGKFPVVQHFGFGSLFRWEADPNAAREQSSEHARRQPKARSMDVPPPPPPPPPGTSGTQAPWASNSSVAGLPAASGMPSTKAPWATAGREQQRPPLSTLPGPGAAASWAASQRLPAKNPGKHPTAGPPTSGDHG